MCALTPRAKRSDRHRGVTPSCPFRHVCRMPQVSGAVPARHSLTRLQLSVSEAETYLSITWFRMRRAAPFAGAAGRHRRAGSIAPTSGLPPCPDTLRRRGSEGVLEPHEHHLGEVAGERAVGGTGEEERRDQLGLEALPLPEGEDRAHPCPTRLPLAVGSASSLGEGRKGAGVSWRVKWYSSSNELAPRMPKATAA